MALSPAVREALRALLTVTLLAAVGWICRRRLDPQRQRQVFAAEVGLVLILMLLLSGLSWKAHFVVLLLPYAVLFSYLADARYWDRGRKVVGVLLGVSFACCTLTGDIITPRGADYAEALGVIMGGGVAAGLAVAVTLRKLRPAGSCTGVRCER